MREYRDVLLEDIAACMRACARRSNPAFIVRPWLRNAAWVGFALRSWRRGTITLKEFFGLLWGGKRDGAVKKKVKEESGREVVDCLGGVPRLVYGDFKMAPHNTSLAGIMDFLTLVQQIFILDQYHARDFIKEDSVVVDAGANIGTFTALASSLAKNGKVYAFEPASPALKILREHVKGARNVEVVPLGLGEKSDAGEMRVNADFPGFSAMRDTGIDGTGGQSRAVLEKVRVTSLDDFVRERRLPRVDFIKIDTEGYEKQILRGAAYTIRTQRPVIAASTYHFPGDRRDIPEIVRGAEPRYRRMFSTRAEEDCILWVPK